MIDSNGNCIISGGILSGGIHSILRGVIRPRLGNLCGGDMSGSDVLFLCGG